MLGRAADRSSGSIERRAYAVALTVAGDQLRARVLARLLECEGRFLAPLGPDQRWQTGHQ